MARLSISSSSAGASGFSGVVGADVGPLLLAMHRGDAGGFGRALAQARAALMPPLAAAAMESYGRAYPHILQLHLLQARHPQPAFTAFGLNYARKAEENGFSFLSVSFRPHS